LGRWAPQKKVGCHDTIHRNGPIGCQLREESLVGDGFNLDNLEWFHQLCPKENIPLFQRGRFDREFLAIKDIDKMTCGRLQSTEKVDFVMEIWMEKQMELL
jgi:hypothetical protein